VEHDCHRHQGRRVRVRLLSAVCCLLFAVCCLLAAVCYLLSTVCYLLSAVCFLVSVVAGFLFNSLTFRTLLIIIRDLCVITVVEVFYRCGYTVVTLLIHYCLGVQTITRAAAWFVTVRAT
jgi:hypothetical protein